MKAPEHGQHTTGVISSEIKHTIALELAPFAALIVH